MKKGLLLLMFLNINAQQNFFNVPSSDITKKNKVFFQQQINFLKDAFQSNSTFNYGIEKNLEIGFNMLGLSFYKDQSNKYVYYVSKDDVPYFPFIMINAQKRFDCNENFGIGIGFQQGISFSNNRLGGYYYANGVYNNEEIGLKYVLGLYAGTTSFLGEGDRLFNNQIGIQTGIEKSIVKEKIVLQTDMISGNHAMGQFVIGGAFYISTKSIFSFGYQVPFINSLAEKAVVVEFSFIQ